LKKILIEKIEGNKSIHRSNEQRNLYKALVEAYESDKIILDIYRDIVMLKRRRDNDADKDKEPSAGSHRGSKRRREGKEPESASPPKEKATRNDELLAGPTYELMNGSCKSLVELEFFLEEVYKAITNQLDWVNTEGQQYPHNLLKPLPLIPNNQGRRVIPFDHFINNDLEYLRGGDSSCKYTTSVTKTKAVDYGHIKWNEDLRNLYKALVESYESDKIILDIYRDIVMLKRHRDNDADKDKEPSAGSHRGSKRRREGKEPKSASPPKEKATRNDGKLQGSKS
nr:hypothetical protein [Tanacetum cinerariifolium]